MSPKDVQSFITAEPFRPFTIYLTDGSSHRVTLPDHAFVMAGVVYVGMEPDQDNMPTYAKHINLRQITRIEAAMPDAA
ncbi:MAG: hypothetical protein AAF823_13530 [Planctomycetota bacterium]